MPVSRAGVPLMGPWRQGQAALTHLHWARSTEPQLVLTCQGRHHPADFPLPAECSVGTVGIRTGTGTGRDPGQTRKMEESVAGLQTAPWYWSLHSSKLHGLQHCGLLPGQKQCQARFCTQKCIKKYRSRPRTFQTFLCPF